MRKFFVHSLPMFVLAAATATNAQAQADMNSDGTCLNIAQIQQHASNGFERLRGKLVVQNAEMEIYQATLDYLDEGSNFIYVVQAPKQPPFYTHVMKYRDGVTAEQAQKWLPLMRYVVEQCYGKDVSISCSANRCSAHSSTTRELVFGWKYDSNTSGFSIFQSGQLPADARWLATAARAPTLSPPRNELLEACARTHHDWATKNGYNDWPDSKIARWCGCISRNLAPAMTASERQQFMADAPAFVFRALDDPPPGQQRNWRLYSPIGACRN